MLILECFKICLLVCLLLVPGVVGAVVLQRDDLPVPQVLHQPPEHVLAQVEEGEEPLVPLLLAQVDVDGPADGAGRQDEAEEADEDGGRARAAAAAPAAAAAAAAAAPAVVVVVVHHGVALVAAAAHGFDWKNG